MKYGYALISQRYNKTNDVVEENYNKSSIRKFIWQIFKEPY